MINILDYGFTPAMMPLDAQGIPARVTAAHKDRYELACEYGVCSGRLKTSVYYGKNNIEEFPVVGDYVLINYSADSDSHIIKTLERKSKFSRSDFSGHSSMYSKVVYSKTVLEQILAVNFDYVFLMQSLNQDLNIKRLERYLIMAWQSGAVPVVVLTKADLIDNYTEKVREVEKAAADVGVFAVSAKTSYGLDTLAEYLKPRKTIVFLGSSGVGKSSLVNAIAGEDIMAVKEIRDDDGKGRHTTTHRQLVMLSSGVMLIDTPGMRELGMWDASESIGEVFTDVEQYLGKCKFTNCKHNSEPGCAVKAALESGELTRGRWENYLQMENEIKFADDKSAYIRSQNEHWRKAAKQSRSGKKKSGGKKK